MDGFDMEDDYVKLTVEKFLLKRLNSRPSYVFDLRSMEDFETEHIAGAHSLPFEMLEPNLHKMPFTGEMLFHDGGEGIAKKAAEIIEENGFSDFYYMEEGYTALKEGLKNPAYQLKMSCTKDDSKEVKMEVIQNLLDFEINPKVASHGGVFSLVDIEDNRVFVELGGGCQGCGMVDQTLRQGVEQRMKEVYPDMEELVDTTDHAGGDDPFFHPGK